MRIRLVARLAVACLLAGVGLLNVADATWAHALGVVCLIGFVILAFGAIAVPALDQTVEVGSSPAGERLPPVAP